MTQLIGTVYPARSNPSTDIIVDHMCEWALGSCKSVTEFASAISNGTVTVVGPSVAGGQHYVLRDSNGTSAVVEFLDGRTVVTMDYNDNGATGFGELV